MIIIGLLIHIIILGGYTDYEDKVYVKKNNFIFIDVYYVIRRGGIS
jgi:hypothetical protein